MAILNLFPDTTVSTDGTPTIVGGSASIQAALSDNTDATYVVIDNGDKMRLGIAALTLPALAQIRTITIIARINAATSDDRFEIIRWEPSSGLYEIQHINPGTTIGNFNLLQSTISLGTGIAYTKAEVDAIECSINHINDLAGGTSTVYVYRLYLQVITNEAPVATVTAPAEGSSVTNTTKPTVTWTYSDPESNAQERYRVKIFTDAESSVGGFNPDTGAVGSTGMIVFPVWDSGEIYSAGTSVSVPVDLVNGTTYRAYVKVADVGSGGRYGAWDYNVFTINVTPPPAPALVVTPQPNDPKGPRTKLDLTRTSSATPTTYMVIEYSDDSGVTWNLFRGAEKVVNSPDGTTFTFYDYEATPNKVRQYRAKAVRTV